MWKVAFEDRFGSSLIYWVDGSSPTEAETTARQQAGARITDAARAVVAQADDLDAVDDVWPRPRLVDGVRVFTFDDSREAYDQTQVRDDIHDGDVLHIPGEKVAGFLMQAWPVAVSAERGAFHGLVDPNDLVIDGRDYSESVRVAQALVPTTQPPARSLSPACSNGLQYAEGVWTITIDGAERLAGQTPWIWVVNAPNATLAAASAERYHRTTQEDPDTLVRYVDPGAPAADYPWAYDDIRGMPSRALVLTPDNIRRIAQIRLACRRLDRHIAHAEASAKGATEAEKAGLILARAALVTSLVRQLMDELGYGI